MLEPLSVAQVAEKLGLPYEGNGQILLQSVAGLREAGDGELSFLANPKYVGMAAKSRASAILVSLDFKGAHQAGALIRSDNPDRDFARACVFFTPAPVVYPRGVHATAVIGANVTLGADVRVGPWCVVEDGARIGDRVTLVAQNYVGHGAVIGDDTHLYPLSSVREHCVIGRRCILHNGCVVGSDGFGYSVNADGSRTKIPQVGIVDVGDDVEIGANAAIDRARFGRTRIGKGVKIDNLAQIAHNVVIGEHSVIVAQVGIAGSTVVGDKVIIAGQAGIVGHISIGDGAVIGGNTGVTKDVPAGDFVFGTPAEPFRKFSEAHANVMRLPLLKERVQKLEEKVGRLEQGRPPEG